MSDYQKYECAFCGEENSLLIDSHGGRRYTLTEDCQVCCRRVLTLDVTPEYDA
jgi:hypothetical protein